eukprot:Polyplicarium_translucidae@DN2590_c0_g1_i1.p1
MKEWAARNGIDHGKFEPKGKYLENHRPQWHFTPFENYMGDPGGLVYDASERLYHAHYEYHPWGSKWGPTHWGHAVSDDLLHWLQLPVAIYPDEHGTILSGGSLKIESSAQAIKANLAIGTVVFFYTQHCIYGRDQEELAMRDPLKLECYSLNVPPHEGSTTGFDPEDDATDYYIQHQSMSWTTDFVNYTISPRNPIIPGNLSKYGKNFRSPTVFWGEDTEAFHMILANENRVVFLRSDDLLDWEEYASFGGGEQQPVGVAWETPELVDLGDDLWALLLSVKRGRIPEFEGSGTSYFLGTLDNGVFVPDDRWRGRPDVPPFHLDEGTDFSAARMWRGHQLEERVIQGWMNNWAYSEGVPSHPWRSQLSTPRALHSHVREGGDTYIRMVPFSNAKQLRCGNYETFNGAVGARMDAILALNPCVWSGRAYDGVTDFEMFVFAKNEDEMRARVYVETLDRQVFLSIQVARDMIVTNRSSVSAVDDEDGWFQHNASAVQHFRRPADYLRDFRLRILLDRGSLEIFVDND